MSEEHIAVQPGPEIKERLWTRNFFILWQGQLVSAFGDVVYELALGFWVLAVTGSTALMGTLMAASSIPRIIISPFAGVFVDRADRKKLIVIADLIRGIAITFVGIAAYMHFLRIWMVFAAGIIMSTCAAFFNPSVSSSIPDITHKSKLIKANSFFNMIYTGTNTIANPVGGVIYQFLGAPFMFLLNGISYLYASFTGSFLKIPMIERANDKQEIHFFSEMMEGFSFIWRFRGLRNLLVMACVLNFFANIGFVLFIPFFSKTEGLGTVKYGIAMSVLSIGMLSGMLFTSAVDIPSGKRYWIFTCAFIVSLAAWTFFPFAKLFVVMSLLLGIGGFLNQVFNVFFSATLQMTVPQDMRGKVFSLLSTISGGLAPVSFAIGGVLGGILPVKLVISGSMLIALLVYLPFGFTMSTKRFVSFDPEKETLEDIINI